jgi:outer membrane protein assembly factor BamB
MGRRQDGLVEVELVDDDADLDDGRPRGPSRVRQLGPWWQSRPARLRSRLTRLGTAVAAVACVAVVVQHGNVAAGEAALELLPGRSVSLDQPLNEAWRLDSANPVGWIDGDLVVTGGSTTMGAQRIDPATGTVRWSVPSTGWCSPLDPAMLGFLGGAMVPSLDGVRLICAPNLGYPPGDALDPVSTTILLDPADGSSSPGPRFEGDLLGMFPVESDIVLAAATSDGRVHAERWSPDSGRTVWTYASTDAVIDHATGYGAGRVGTSTLEVYGSRNLAIDLMTGHERPAQGDVPSPGVWGAYTPSERTLADGSTVRETPGETWSFERTSADGSALAPLPGWPVSAGVDDGSGTGVVLVVTTDGLVASVDLASGTTLWSTEGYGVVAVLDGLAVVQGSTTISARDIRTGALAWSDPLPTDLFTGTAVTDGHRVAYLTLDSGLVLRVVDLRTGTEHSRTPIDGYGAWLVGAAPDGTVLVATYEGRLSGLRP